MRLGVKLDSVAALLGAGDRFAVFAEGVGLGIEATIFAGRFALGGAESEEAEGLEEAELPER